jgi:rhamnose utilization protein RhaD (predicted bifunctional aldolase and dehydrogenase)
MVKKIKEKEEQIEGRNQTVQSMLDRAKQNKKEAIRDPDALMMLMHEKGMCSSEDLEEYKKTAAFVKALEQEKI